MTTPKVDKIYTQWRKANRQVLELPYMTHYDMLPFIANNMSLDCILDCKYIAFYKSIEKSENKIIKYTAKNKVFDHTSTLGKNITHLLNKYDIVVDDILSLSKHRAKELCYNKWLSGVNIEFPVYVQIVKDMIEMREGRCRKEFLNEDCKFIIDFCCLI